ncbi:SDR family NAD(P)-dependent oxidoreductase [Acetobacter senegalensis]|uniref:oxidoreductase n=1 Tax=Acetobacter senegalensis TaxID=446692 RepID=UPI0007C6D32D|nr:oxidoreductase [Acetobacter senegalensis]MCG4262020.1 SDR family NAD(P)-dependent oxidoreductase [Acetobacter senegalensis]OAG71672.1 oxidoreductase [Gluconobacter japonicus]
MPTIQAPIGSGFDAHTTAVEVIQGCDLTGKTAIVTGGYSGIGLITARTLAGAGARVIVPARHQEKAREALNPYPELELESLDLIDPVSIDAFADRFLATGQSLHILVNNAGIMAPPLIRDSRGYESQFATNHLGHFQLTARLWPALRRADGARVVSLSSRGHMRSPVDFDDWNFEHRSYDRWIAYGQSKSANALFAVALDEIGADKGVRAFSVHPGGIITDLVRYMAPEELRAAGAIDEHGTPIIDPDNNMKTPEQGAATSIWCATSPQLDGKGGVYCENVDIAVAEPADSKSLLGVRPWATDPVLAQRLWTLSERLTSKTLT